MILSLATRLLNARLALTLLTALLAPAAIAQQPVQPQGRLKVRCKASGAAMLVPVLWGLLWSHVSAFTES